MRIESMANDSMTIQAIANLLLHTYVHTFEEEEEEKIQSKTKKFSCKRKCEYKKKTNLYFMENQSFFSTLNKKDKSCL